MRTLLVLGALALGACAPTRPEPTAHPQAQGRHRRVCASEGFSCVPGPCCHGLKCIDDVCKKPSKKD